MGGVFGFKGISGLKHEAFGENKKLPIIDNFFYALSRALSLTGCIPALPAMFHAGQI
jgi:hypothetical protein